MPGGPAGGGGGGVGVTGPNGTGATCDGMDAFITQTLERAASLAAEFGSSLTTTLFVIKPDCTHPNNSNQLICPPQVY